MWASSRNSNLAQSKLNSEDVFGRNLNGSNLQNHSNYGSGVPSTYATRTMAGSLGLHENIQNVKEQNKSRGSSNFAKNERNFPSLPLQNHNFLNNVNSNYYDQSINSNIEETDENLAPYELVISNLVATTFDIRPSLLKILEQYAQIERLQLIPKPSECSLSALVRVTSLQDVQNIISNLHLKYFPTLGTKRLIVSQAPNNNNRNNNNMPFKVLKEMVVMLLMKKPKYQMPLVLLIDALANCFFVNTSVSELNKLKDVCTIYYDNEERIIALTPESRTSPPSNRLKMNMLPYCTKHCPKGMKDLFGDGIIYVHVPLNVFSNKLDILLKSHGNSLAFLSFSNCYFAEFGEHLPIDKSGVALEHLVTCVKNVKIITGDVNKNIKFIKRSFEPDEDEHDSNDDTKFNNKSAIPNNLFMLKRQIVELLKGMEKCQLPLAELVPAYHHRFSVQIHVGDYGFTRLSDLLSSEVISKTIQILGENDKRVITLTHYYQKHRFATEMSRILQKQTSCTLNIEDFFSEYENLFKRPFNPVDYGVCTLEDLFNEVPKYLLPNESGESITKLAIPKRQRTLTEILLTVQFENDVKRLLAYMADCSITFNKFICSYHHNFGFQCRLSDYGFTKLIELLESIPEIITINEDLTGERKITLTQQAALEVRGNQISDLIIKSDFNYIPLDSLFTVFENEFSLPLLPAVFGCMNITEICSRLNAYIQISHSSAGPLLVLVKNHKKLALRLWALLIEPPYKLGLFHLMKSYYVNYAYPIDILNLEDLHTVQIIETDADPLVKLTELYEKAAKLYSLLLYSGGQLQFDQLNKKYIQSYNSSLFNEDNEEQLFKQFSFMIVIRNVRRKTVVSLNPKLKELGLQIQLTDAKLDRANYKMWFNSNISEHQDRNEEAFQQNTPESLSAKDYCWQEFQPQALEEFPNIQMKTNLQNLLPSYTYPVSPHPHQLPIPDKLLKKDDSSDSGVHHSNLTDEMEVSNEEKFKFAFFESFANSQEQKEF